MNHEVELRALITKSDFSRISQYANKEGKELGKVRRFLVDYSTYLESVRERKKDIRVRSTNGRREIIVKIGGLASEGRREESVAVAGSMRDLLTVMAMMGFTKGTAALKNIYSFQFEEIELSLHEILIFEKPSVPNSYFLEVEILTDATHEASAILRLKEFLKQLHLAQVSEEEWYQYIEQINKDANGVFEYGKTNLDTVDSLG